ncbi:MAG: OsmC family protein [Terriglobales bacterium]
MEVSVEHLGSVQFEIKARQHVIVSDQPADNGGFDEGMTPPELLLASLGSCAAFDAAAYLRKHKVAERGTKVRVAADKRKDPPRLDDFRITINIPSGLDPKHVEGVERAVHQCLIHNTLLNPPAIAIEIHGPVLAT